MENFSTSPSIFGHYTFCTVCSSSIPYLERKTNSTHMWCQVRAQSKPGYIDGSSILYQPCSRLEVGTIPLQLILELLNAKTEVNQGSARQVIPAFSGRSTGEVKYESTKNRSEKCETLQKSLQDSPPLLLSLIHI